MILDSSDFTFVGSLESFRDLNERKDYYKRKELEFELKRYQDAIAGITKWLSASINDDCCKQYVQACNKCFDVDTQFDKMKDLKDYEYRE